MKSLLFILVFGMFAVVFSGCSSSQGWREASRASAHIAPDPTTTDDAIIHVYGADAWGWRGWFAIHTWIAAKRSTENFYRVYELIGWRANRGLPLVRIERDIPDRYWFGAKPRLLMERRGHGIDSLIDKVDTAARNYPWPETYKAVPGPNSNTFIAWIAGQIPELELSLPWSAIGSSYADKGKSPTESIAGR